MTNMVDIPILENKVVLLIVGIIVGYLLFLFIKKNNPSLLNCNTIEKFGKKNNGLYQIKNNLTQQMKPILKQSVQPQPVLKQPVQPIQPVLKQPGRPVYQQPGRPVYQQPGRPVYQQPGHQKNKLEKFNNTENNDRPNKRNNDEPNKRNKDEPNKRKNDEPNRKDKQIPRPNFMGDLYSMLDDNLQIDDIYAKVHNLNSIEQFTQDPEKSIKVYNFNTSWCGWSKKFQPEWDLFMSKINSDPILNNLVEVKDIKCDNDDNKQLCIDNEVYGYPTVIINVDGKGTKYEGPRTSDDLMDAVNKIISSN